MWSCLGAERSPHWSVGRVPGVTTVCGRREAICSFISVPGVRQSQLGGVWETGCVVVALLDGFQREGDMWDKAASHSKRG